MEAALRTVSEVHTGKPLEKLEFETVRGNEGIKEAIVALGKDTIKIAIAHGLRNAELVMRQIEEGTCDYTFIEIMACPGGCIGGGGQPISGTKAVKMLRQDALYDIDKGQTIRKSHENPDVIRLYEEFLEKPLSEKAHHLLHTHYGKQFKRTTENV